MKFASITTTLLLLIPVITCAIDVLNSAMPAFGEASVVARPVIFYGVSYLLFFILSILLNVKRKFLINIILSGSLVLIYFVTVNLIKAV